MYNVMYVAHDIYVCIPIGGFLQGYPWGVIAHNVLLN